MSNRTKSKMHFDNINWKLIRTINTSLYVRKFSGKTDFVSNHNNQVNPSTLFGFEDNSLDNFYLLYHPPALSTTSLHSQTRKSRSSPHMPKRWKKLHKSESVSLRNNMKKSQKKNIIKEIEGIYDLHKDKHLSDIGISRKSLNAARRSRRSSETLRKPSSPDTEKRNSFHDLRKIMRDKLAKVSEDVKIGFMNAVNMKRPSASDEDKHKPTSPPVVITPKRPSFNSLGKSLEGYAELPEFEAVEPMKVSDAEFDWDKLLEPLLEYKKKKTEELQKKHVPPPKKKI